MEGSPASHTQAPFPPLMSSSPGSIVLQSQPHTMKTGPTHWGHSCALFQRVVWAKSQQRETQVCVPHRAGPPLAFVYDPPVPGAAHLSPASVWKALTVTCSSKRALAKHKSGPEGISRYPSAPWRDDARVQRAAESLGGAQGGLALIGGDIAERI